MDTSYKSRLINAADIFLELEEDQKASYLAELERNYGLDFRKQMERLLFAAENSSLLDQPGFPGIAEPDWTDAVLGKRYRICRRLGSGAFGTVWLGEDLDDARKSVAVKIPNPLHLSNMSEKALEAEITSLAYLSHPLVAAVMNHGVMENGLPFLVMQYIPGTPLRELINGTPWEPQRVSCLVAYLADALGSAHYKGILHLDFRPENILVCDPTQASELPYIVDFGIAGIKRRLTTRTNSVPWAGSRPYAAPEYRRGNYEAQGDTYSLAVVTLELLLGGLPDTNLPEPHLDLLIPDALPPRMRTALQQALCIAPEVRPSSPLAFSEALGRPANNATNYFFQSSLPEALLSTEVRNNMTNDTRNTHSFGGDLGLMTQIRQEFAAKLENIADSLVSNEEQNEQNSGGLYLVNEVKSARTASDALRAGRFKVAVVGDMKRGKSTILNVLLGVDFLPVAVTRCTAVLTTVKYGDMEKVIVHYTAASRRQSETLSTTEFKKRFTLKPEAQRELEAQGQHAFPDVEYAEIETPNPLLEKGLEIIDTPGLNDTPELNQLTLEFAKDCNAILFVLNPQTMVTMQEKQYFESHFQGRGLPVFFLINRWDQIRHQLMDPDDPTALQEAEDEIRRQIRSGIEPLLKSGDGGPVTERVHELSALQAWKRIAKNPNATLEGTGFDCFYTVLTQFLKEGRIRAEMRSARILASNMYREVHRKITDRIGMLGTTKSEFEQNYEAVKPLFEDLRKIRDRVKNEFEQAERTEPQLIASNLNGFIRGLDTNLRNEFAAYMPDLSYWQTIKLIASSEQQQFTAQVKNAFSQFLQHKMPLWERDAMRMIENSIQRLQSVTEGYAIDYAVNMDAISQCLTGGNVMEKHDITADDSPWWTRAVAGGAAFILGDPLGAGLAAHKLFNWRDVAKNIAVVVSSQVMLYLVTGGVLGPVGVIIVALVAGLVSAGSAAKRLKERVTDALAKGLPDLAMQAEEEASRHIYEIYRGAKERVLAAIEADLESRQAEIDNLRSSMRQREIDNEQERVRLLAQDAALLAAVHDTELAEDRWLKAL